jgi:hypothetical protein
LQLAADDDDNVNFNDSCQQWYGASSSIHSVAAIQLADAAGLGAQLQLQQAQCSCRSSASQIMSQMCSPLLRLQTDTYLEELTDVVPEADSTTQTDAFLDRPPTPQFVAPKSGIDAATQIEKGKAPAEQANLSLTPEGDTLATVDRHGLPVVLPTAEAKRRSPTTACVVHVTSQHTFQPRTGA